MSLAKKYLKAILKLEAENKELRRIIAQQAEIIAQQKKTIELQAKRIDELEVKLAKFTAHPSTPSGMKPPYEKEPTKRRRKKPGQKQNHQGHHRDIPEEINKEKDWTLSECPDCGCQLGSPVIKKVLGKVFGGILICDFFSAYGKVVSWAKQRCIVHLFRELEKVSAKNKTPQWLGFTKRLKRLLKDAMRLSAKQEELEANTYKSKSDRLHQRLKMIYSQEYEDADCKRIAKRLKKHKDEIFTFVDHPEVSADNNHAERQIRPAVVMRKNSYCNRSTQGADTQAILMSIFRTLHLRRIDPIPALTHSLSEWIKTGNVAPLPGVSLQMGK